MELQGRFEGFFVSIYAIFSFNPMDADLEYDFGGGYFLFDLNFCLLFNVKSTASESLL